MIRTVDSVAIRLRHPNMSALQAPVYAGSSSKGIALAVEDMKRHTADAGWQVMAGLDHAGYELCGYKLPINTTQVPAILERTQPGVAVIQDKREWDPPAGNFREQQARFHGVGAFRGDSNIFKLTIVKDAHHRPGYHRQSAEEMGVHAWIIYYHPHIVCRVAPYIRREHAIRTHHSVDPGAIPSFTAKDRSGCLLSGAISVSYPLRIRMRRGLKQLPEVTYKRHPGYHARGCVTPKFLELLSHYKVAICTSSIFGYTLRKHVEATACGCIVVTDLPSDDVMPGIDGNFVRVSSSIQPKAMATLLKRLYVEYDAEKQREFARRAIAYYDFRAIGQRLVDNINRMRLNYNGKEETEKSSTSP